MKRPDNRALLGRRLFVAGLAGSSLMPLARAQSRRATTPTQTLGPFYPRNAAERPADTGPDLLRDDGRRVLTRGTPILLTGRLVNLTGEPQRGRVEIWQCDANAVYHHPAGGAENERDPHFQGYGVGETDSQGTFRFRTILPVAYPGRTPHIHVRAVTAGYPALATQLYLPDHPGNRRDFLFSRLSDVEREMLTLKLVATPAQLSADPLARLTRQTAVADLVIG